MLELVYYKFRFGRRQVLESFIFLLFLFSLQFCCSWQLCFRGEFSLLQLILWSVDWMWLIEWNLELRLNNFFFISLSLSHPFELFGILKWISAKWLLMISNSETIRMSEKCSDFRWHTCPLIWFSVLIEVKRVKIAIQVIIKSVQAAMRLHWPSKNLLFF